MCELWINFFKRLDFSPSACLQILCQEFREKTHIVYEDIIHEGELFAICDLQNHHDLIRSFSRGDRIYFDSRMRENWKKKSVYVNYGKKEETDKIILWGKDEIITKTLFGLWRKNGNERKASRIWRKDKELLENSLVAVKNLNFFD